MAKHLFHFLRHYKFTLLLVAFICYGSLAPLPPETLPQFRWSDKVVHLLMYAVLALCIRMEYRSAHKDKPTGSLPWLWTVLAPIIMGGTIELAQAYLTTGRSGDWVDFAANTIGVLLATAIPRLVHKSKPTGKTSF